MLNAAVRDADVQPKAVSIATSEPKPKKLEFVSLTVTSNPSQMRATVKVKVDGKDETLDCETGVGPVDATWHALERFTNGVVMHACSTTSAGKGSDVNAEAVVEMSWNGITFGGKSSNPNTLNATAEAIINALDTLLRFRARFGNDLVPAFRSNLWAGMLFIEGGGTRNGSTREFSLFHVAIGTDGKLRATHKSDAKGALKKELAKGYHYAKRFTALEARAVGGEICHLLIEKEDKKPSQLS